MKRIAYLALVVAFAALLLISCDRDDTPDFTLQLLHASDMDGATGALDNVETFSAMLDAFRSEYANSTLVLSSGDNYIPGPRFFAAGDDSNDPVLGVSGDGRGDVALLNAMGFQASALGNHELDRGAGVFASIIDAETGDSGAYPGAKFPYLSSNLVFTDDEDLRPLVVADGQDVSQSAGKLAGSAIITVGGERIGVVGATTPHLASITGAGGITVNPADESDIDALAAVIQKAVDALTAQDVDKVILLAHMQQIAVEKELATRLAGVDIVVAGGSNTVLADDNDRLRPGDEAADTYPLRFDSPTGEPVLLVNTDADYRYLGRLVLGFDDEGVVMPDSIDSSTSGAYATDDQGARESGGQPIAEVIRIADSIRSVLRERGGNVLGSTSVYLAGRRGDVRTQETNLGNLAASADLWTARQFDPDVAVSLKNGGGIRDDIGMVVQPPGTTDPSGLMFLPPQADNAAGTLEGDISQFHIEGTLRFNNGLAIVPLTAVQFVEIIEHSVAFDGVGEVTEGRFPQVAGMRFSFDPSAPSGQRVRSLAIVGDDGAVTARVVHDGELVVDPDRTVKMVTLSFLANGGDGYPFPVPAPGRIDLAGESDQPNPPNPDFPDTNGNGVIDTPALTDPGLATFASPGTEQDSIAEYLFHFHADTPYATAEIPPLHDQRIQNLATPNKQDTVFRPR